MKRLLTLLFTMAVLASNAQYPVITASVSGYVTEQGTNLAIEGHLVRVILSANDSTGTMTMQEVYTNNNGYYNFTGTINGMNGYMYVETYDCNDFTFWESFEISYNANNTFTADFQICNDSLGCNAEFYYYQLDGLTFNFMTAAPPNNNYSYSWNFGDGTYAYEPYPVKTYENPGDYEVTLTVTSPDSTCFATSSQMITAGGESCKAFFTYWNNPSGDLTVSFADSSQGNPTNWFWDFGDGSYATEQFPTHTYTEPGFYYVCLTISSDDNMCSSIFCDNIMVGNVPCLSQFTYYPVDSVNMPNAIQFVDLSYGAPTQWSWDFGDGTGSSEQNPMHSYQNTGMYQVCLTISGPECQSTWCMDVWVDDWTMCYNYFTYLNAGGTTIEFEGFCSSELPATYVWDLGDGTTLEGNTVTHEYPAPGIYFVTLLTYDSAGCMTYSSQEVLVGDTMFYNQVYGQVLEGSFPLTNGFVMIFSVEDGNNYYPYFDMTMVDTSGIFVFPMVPVGNYNILAVPTDGSNYLPTYYESTIFWQEASVVVAGQTPNPLVIQLQNAQGTANSGPGVITGHISETGIRDGFIGQIIIYLTDADHNILTFTQVSQGGDFSFTNLAYGDYFLKAELAGVYSDYMPVTLSAAQSESTVNMTFTGNSILGQPESISADANVNLYPNPAKDVTRIVFNQEESGMVEITLTDLAGRQVSGQEVSGSTGTTSLDLDLKNTQPGIYILNVRFKDGSHVSRKLIKN